LVNSLEPLVLFKKQDTLVSISISEKSDTFFLKKSRFGFCEEPEVKTINYVQSHLTIQDYFAMRSVRGFSTDSSKSVRVITNNTNISTRSVRMAGANSNTTGGVRMNNSNTTSGSVRMAGANSSNTTGGIHVITDDTNTIRSVPPVQLLPIQPITSDKIKGLSKTIDPQPSLLLMTDSKHKDLPRQEQDQIKFKQEQEARIRKEEIDARIREMNRRNENKPIDVLTHAAVFMVLLVLLLTNH